MDFPGYEATEDESIDEGSEEDERNICDTCEREFQSHWQYQKHMSEHRTCGLDGCTFTAHEKIIEKHIQMQHSSGLYDKIRNLITPEDIEKWVAERKKKYPTRENMERRYQQQEEMLKRGERLTTNSQRFDRKNKTRFAFNRNNKQQTPHHRKTFPHRRQPQQRKTPATSLLDDRSDWNGALFPFRGTNQLYIEEPVESIVNDFDDNEWIEDSSKAKTSTNKVVLSNALGSLMSAYNSSDDSETEDTVPKNTVSVVNAQNSVENATLAIAGSSAAISDDESPMEQKIERVAVADVAASVSMPEEKPNDKCKRKRKRNKKKETECTNQETESSNTNKHNSRNRVNSQNMQRSQPYKKRRVTLLERLLSNEIIHERNVLLQCVRYVVMNNFFDEKSGENENPEVPVPSPQLSK